MPTEFDAEVTQVHEALVAADVVEDSRWRYESNGRMQADVALATIPTYRIINCQVPMRFHAAFKQIVGHGGMANYMRRALATQLRQDGHHDLAATLES